MEWRYLGDILEAKNSGCSGVYLIVHKGKFDRTVYVGVSNNVGRRISEHYEGYMRGNRTIYNAGKNEDVYRFMSALNIRNHTTHYQNLASQFKIWASTTVYSEFPQNLLDTKQIFSNKWQDIAVNLYIPQLVVWALPMSNYTYDSAAKIESTIQKKIVSAFDLRGFFNVKQLSILGKIEYPLLDQIALDVSPPKLDKASQIILSCLSEPNIPISAHEIIATQLKRESVEREKLKAEAKSKRRVILYRYKNYGKPWTQEHLEKLRVMLVEFELTPSQMSPHLGRDPRAIAKRINDNDKLSNSMWRKGIKWL